MREQSADNAPKSRISLVGVDDDTAASLREGLGPSFAVRVLPGVEALLTASGLGTLDCEVVLLGRPIAEPVRVAQRIHALDKNIQVMIITPADRFDEYRRLVDFSPSLSDAVTLSSRLDGAKLPETVKRAVKRAHRRCSYRRTGNGVDGGPTATHTEINHYVDSLLDHAPIGMITLDDKGRVQTLNRQGRELLSVSEKDVLDTPFVGFFSPEDQLRIRRLISAGGPRETSQPFVVGASPGERRSVELTVSAFDTRAGEPGQMVILHDVTERVRAEEERSRAAAALQASEDRLLELAAVLRIVPWEADARTMRYRYVGELAEEILGYPRERWYEPHFWAQILHPDDRSEALRRRRSNSRRLQNFDHEYRIVTADGDTIWIRDVINVVRDENDDPVRLRGVMVDVSERRGSTGRAAARRSADEHS